MNDLQRDKIRQWAALILQNNNLPTDFMKQLQSAVGTTPDGIFGPNTYRAVRKELIKLLLPTDQSKRLLTVPADAVAGGFKQLTLRSDVAQKFNELKNSINKAGGVVTTAGGLRSLADSGRPNTSFTSLHYGGIAFDLALGSGGMNPETDPYVLEQLPNGTWTVWARAKSGTLTTINNPVTYSQRRGTGKPVTGNFVNFTECAQSLGFRGIRAHSNWLTGGPMTAAEWWHFQYEYTLLEGYTTFGEELELIYPSTTLSRFSNIQSRRHLVWQKGWWG